MLTQYGLQVDGGFSWNMNSMNLRWWKGQVGISLTLLPKNGLRRTLVIPPTRMVLFVSITDSSSRSPTLVWMIRRTNYGLYCRNLVWLLEPKEKDLMGKKLMVCVWEASWRTIGEPLKGPFWPFSVKLITHSRWRNLQQEMSPTMLIQSKIWL